MRMILFGMLFSSLAVFQSFAVELKPGKWVATIGEGQNVYGAANMQVSATGLITGTGFSTSRPITFEGRINAENILTIRIDDGLKTRIFRSTKISADGTEFQVTVDEGYRFTARKVTENMPFAGVYRGIVPAIFPGKNSNDPDRLLIVVGTNGVATAFIYVFSPTQPSAPLTGKVIDKEIVEIRENGYRISGKFSKGFTKANLKGTLKYGTRLIDFTIRYLD